MSFFERLTGTVNVDEQANEYQNSQKQGASNQNQYHGPAQQPASGRNPENVSDDSMTQSRRQRQKQEQETKVESEGQLSVDVYETPNEIVIQTMVGGVHPDDLDVSITREMCTISGKREGPRDVARDDYFHQELYWGAFSRKVVLPQEIEPEEAEAVEKHGLLIIKLPKIDKDKQTTLEVESQE